MQQKGKVNSKRLNYENHKGRCKQQPPVPERGRRLLLNGSDVGPFKGHMPTAGMMHLEGKNAVTQQLRPLPLLHILRTLHFLQMILLPPILLRPQS